MRLQGLNSSVNKAKKLRFHGRNIWSCSVMHSAKCNWIQVFTPGSTHSRLQTQLKEPPVNDRLSKHTHSRLNRPPFHCNNKPSQTLVSYVWLTKTPSPLLLTAPSPPNTQQTSHSFPEKTFDCWWDKETKQDADKKNIHNLCPRVSV